MKKFVESYPSALASLSEIKRCGSRGSIFGMKIVGRKHVLSYSFDEGFGGFTFVQGTSLGTYGNEKDLETLFKAVWKDEMCEMFVFDSVRELAEWILDDKK